METKEYYHERKHCYHSPWRFVGFGILGVLGFAVFLILGGAVIMILWNWLMPSLFHLSFITFWQAVGLALLARLLFGAFHHNWHRRRMWHHGHGHHPFYRWRSEGSKNENCRKYYEAWQHYDKFWEEEGAQAFRDYIKRKSENPEQNKDNVV